MVEDHDKVVDLVLKQKLEQKKRQRKNKTVKKIKKITLIVLLGLFSYFYYSSNVSKAKTINVSGNYVLSKDEVLNISKVNLNTRLILANPFIIKNRLKQHPLINDAKISSSLFSRYININVSEVDVFAYRYQNNEPIMLMLNGSRVKLLEDFYKFMPNLIFLEGFEDESVEKRLVESFQSLERDVINQISEIHQTKVSFDEHYIMIRMNDGNKIYTSFQTVDRLNFYFDIITKLKASNTCIIIDEMSGEAYSQPCDTLENGEE